MARIMCLLLSWLLVGFFATFPLEANGKTRHHHHHSPQGIGRSAKNETQGSSSTAEEVLRQELLPNSALEGGMEPPASLLLQGLGAEDDGEMGHGGGSQPNPVDLLDNLAGSFRGSRAPSAIRGVNMGTVVKIFPDIVDSLVAGFCGNTTNVRELINKVLMKMVERMEQLRNNAIEDFRTPTLQPLIAGKYDSVETWLSSLFDYYPHCTLIFYNADAFKAAREAESWMVEDLNAGEGMVVLVNLGTPKGMSSGDTALAKKLQKKVLRALHAASGSMELPQIFIRTVYAGKNKAELNGYYSGDVGNTKDYALLRGDEDNQNFEDFGSLMALPEEASKYDKMVRGVLGIHPEDYIDHVVTKFGVVAFLLNDSGVCSQAKKQLMALSPPKDDALFVTFNDDNFMKSILHSRLSTQQKLASFSYFLERKAMQRALPIIFALGMPISGEIQLNAVIDQVNVDISLQKIRSIERKLAVRRRNSVSHDVDESPYMLFKKYFRHFMDKSGEQAARMYLLMQEPGHNGGLEVLGNADSSARPVIPRDSS